jgi:hypothetical protein
VAYEYNIRFIPAKEKGWHELGADVADLSAEGWELFMAVPIHQPSFFWFGWSGGRTSAIVHYCRRPRG